MSKKRRRDKKGYFTDNLIEGIDTSRTHTRTYALERCHTGAIPVFTDPVSGLQFKGGGELRGLVLRDELVITAVGDPSPVKVHGMSRAGLEAYTNPVIELNWLDGSGFTLGVDFWQAMLKKIRTEKLDALCMCQGGHGRTGTMLAIFASLTGATTGDPVQFVREHYCKEAIETREQVKYIEKITGLKVRSSASHKVIGGFASLKDWKNWWDKDAEGSISSNDKLPGWGEITNHYEGD